jgi:Protein of unknown function (DUF4242)
MTRPATSSYVAECFWSGVVEDDLRALDRRIDASVLDCGDESVRYLGSVLIVDDEVVLCLFEGPLAAVRQVAQRAGVPFERILRSTRVPWSHRRADKGEL